MSCESADQFVEKMGGPAYYGGLAEGFVGVSPLNEATVAPGTQEAIEAVTELIVSGEWDVFTGTKLHITVNEDGTVTVDQEDADLLCDGYEYDTAERHSGGARSRYRGRRRRLRGGLRHHRQHELLRRGRGGRQLRRFPEQIAEGAGPAGPAPCSF